MEKSVRRVRRTVFGVLTLLACASIAADAFAGDKKSYNADFCAVSALDDAVYYGYEGFWVGGPATANCPIIRDQTDDDLLPRILVEARQYSNTDRADLGCQLVWMNEDSKSGTIRGYSETIESSDTGLVQFSFDADAYDYGFAKLSPGGEGTLGLQCYMEKGDYIYQYYVEENRF